jgi:hypothetical protein
VSTDVKDISALMDEKMKALKQDLIKEICFELKGKVMKTW